MNQSILFPDIQDWDEVAQVIKFPAQQSGALIECVITKAELIKLSGIDVSNAEQALQAFSQVRFDVEELAEELIEDEMFNEHGQIVLG